MNNKNLPITNPHTLELKDLFKILNTDENGLKQEQVNKLYEKYGFNVLQKAKKQNIIIRFLKHFNDLLIYILLIASVITALLNHITDTIVILAVVLINTIIGFIQEGKAEKALDSIRKMLSVNTNVKRDNNWIEIEAKKLIPGDLVKLKSGDKVPADIRLIETNNLSIEESALTGESLATEKNTNAVSNNTAIGDRFCMAYSGTTVVSGRGAGIVTATANNTEIGKINKMISEVQVMQTPLTIQMNKFAKTLSFIIIALAFIMFFFGYLIHDFTLSELFMAAIGFAVAAIPEGLPAILTITLSIGVQHMAKRNVITRKLNAIETLGSVTVICSDKTGTLTKNEMTVLNIANIEKTYDVTGIGYQTEGKILLDEKEISLNEDKNLFSLIEAMAVCNDTKIVKDNESYKVVGEPTEGALIALSYKAKFDKSNYKQIVSIPFESKNKFMAVLNKTPNNETMIFLKGAPDRLLKLCKLQKSKKNTNEAIDINYWEEKINYLANKGLRVLAAANKTVADNKNELKMEDIEDGMVFLGIVGIIDPPRPEAIKAIEVFKEAGIKVKMITGDHLETAKAIGKEMGIGDGEHAISGQELDNASDEDFLHLVSKNDIFARTSPEHKLKLVKALQKNGEVVAMTGDGVNDAPALKRANVGVAMGIKGTEATKEASDIVLLDDNFKSIQNAVEQGRTIYDNLIKAIIFILPTNGAEALVILTAVIIGFTLPLTPLQILWVNMVTAVTLALALAFEPSEANIMKRKPRNTNAPIISGLFIWRVLFVSLLIGGSTIALFILGKNFNLSIEQLRTMSVNTLVCGQIFYLFNSRYLKETSLSFSKLIANNVALISVAVLIVLQLIFVYLPSMQMFFGSADLNIYNWLTSIGIGFLVFLIVELEKTIIKKYVS